MGGATYCDMRYKDIITGRPGLKWEGKLGGQGIQANEIEGFSMEQERILYFGGEC